MLDLRSLYVNLLLVTATLCSVTPGLAGENTPVDNGIAFEQPRAGSVYLAPERVELSDDRLVSFERGLIFVPLVRSNRNSKLISVEFCRFKNERRNQELPPIFKLHGGPGFPGLRTPDQAYLENNVWPVTRELGADYVVVGQRGIGSSKPNTMLSPIGGFSAEQRVSTKQFTEAIQKACIEGKAYWESKGYDLEGFNVIEAAADVDDVRQALGYERIVIAGTSFGSHWGMAVMRYHPKAVARAVLSGMEGPDHTWDKPAQVLSALRRIAAEAEQDADIAERLSGRTLIGLVSTVLERLEETPLAVTVSDGDGGLPRDVLLDARAIRGRVLSRMSSRHGIKAWPDRVFSWSEGQFENAAKSHLRNAAPLSGMTASFFLMDCSSGATRSRRRAIDADPSFKIVGRLNQAYRAAESVWNVDLGEAFRMNFDTDIPALIVHGTWDVNTPIENAQELAPHFKNGKLVTVERGSHAALREAVDLSPTFKRQMLLFLRTGDASAVPATVVLPRLDWTKSRKTSHD